eukprot:Gb_39274 [translate_table: standard]
MEGGYNSEGEMEETGNGVLLQGLFQINEMIELLHMPFLEEELNSRKEGGLHDYFEVMDGWSKRCDSGNIKGGKSMEWMSSKNVKGKDPLEDRVYLQVPPKRDKFRFPLLVGVG